MMKSAIEANTLYLKTPNANSLLCNQTTQSSKLLSAPPG